MATIALYVSISDAVDTVEKNCVQATGAQSARLRQPRSSSLELRDVDGSTPGFSHRQLRELQTRMLAKLGCASMILQGPVERIQYPMLTQQSWVNQDLGRLRRSTRSFFAEATLLQSFPKQYRKRS